jgi:hypothetical protein
MPGMPGLVEEGVFCWPGHSRGKPGEMCGACLDFARMFSHVRPVRIWFCCQDGL